MQGVYGLMSTKVEGVKLLCEIQIKQLEEREKRLRLEILDGRLQIEWLKMLIKDIKSINVLNYLDNKKNYRDLKDAKKNEKSETKIE